jgi:hypothetical protein
LESGRSSPKLEEVLRLAAAFGMGLEELVLGDEGAKRYQAVQLARELAVVGSPEEVAGLTRLLQLLLLGYRTAAGDRRAS